VIASDKVIKSDIKKLKKYLYTSNPLITQHCKKIIDYLLVEIHEPIGSTKHTDEEKVTYQNAKNTFDNKDYFQFKDAMDNFYQNYIK
jgi:predicted nucleotidyltransferase